MILFVVELDFEGLQDCFVYCLLAMVLVVVGY